MTLPILPFPTASDGLPPAPGSEPAPAAPFASVLGSVLAGNSPSAGTTPGHALGTTLLGGQRLVGSGGASACTAVTRGIGSASALPSLDGLTNEQLAALLEALGAIDAGPRGAKDGSRSPTFPARSVLTLPDLRAALGALSPDARAALRDDIERRLAPDTSKRASDDASPASSNVATGVATIPGVIAAAMPVAPETIRGGSAAGRAGAGVRLALPSDLTTAHRGLEGLQPDFRDRLQQLIERMHNEFGYVVEVVETVRSPERQAGLFAQGRTAPGPVVTWTLQSPHQDGRAADLKIDGAYTDAVAFQRLSRLARDLGLRSLGARDPGHVELPSSPRIPSAAGTHVGVEPTPTERGRPMTAPPSARDDAHPAGPAGTVPPAGAAILPTRSAAVAGVAQVAAVAQPARVAPVAQPAIVAAVATVAAVGGGQDTRSLRRASEGTILSAASVASSITEPEPGAPTASATIGADAVDRVMASVHAHLERDAQRGGQERDGRGPERDLMAAVRERVEAGGLGQRVLDGLAPRGDVGLSSTEAASNTDMVDRVLHALDARETAAERPLSSVLLRLDHPQGGEDRIRVDLRGQRVSAVLSVRDPVAAERMNAHAPELARALERAGLDAEQVTVRAIRPTDALLTGAAAVATDRDAIRTSTSSSTGGTFGDQQREQRHSRAFDQQPSDHPSGEPRQRGRRDSRGSR